VLLALFEHVAHTRRAHADEHLYEVRAGDRKERHLGLARNRLGEQGLAGTRRADHQHPLGDMPTQLLELGRIAQELHQLGHFFLGFIATGDIGEGDRIGRFVEHAGLGLAERERAATPTALHLAHEEHPYADQQQHREPRHENAHQEGLLFFWLGSGDRHAGLHQVRHHPDILNAGRVHRDLASVDGRCLDHAPVDGGLGYAARAGLLHELRILHGAGRGLARVELVEHRHQHDTDNHPDRKILEKIIQLLFLVIPVMGAIN
jgi:hypothetical protein